MNSPVSRSSRAGPTGHESFAFPAGQGRDSFALDGGWRLTPQSITPTGGSAQVRLNYHAKQVRMVLSGTGTVTYRAGGRTRTIHAAGTPDSHQLLSTPDDRSGTLTVTVGKGVQAYSFTFG